MTQLLDLAGPQFAYVRLSSHAAGDTTIDHVVWTLPRDGRLRRVAIVPDAAVTGVTGATFNLNVRWISAAGAATEVGNRDYATGTNEAAGVKRDIYTPVTPLQLYSGQHVSVQRELVGAGLATPAMLVEVEYDFSGL